MKKRVLCMLMTLIMALGMLPSTAFAKTDSSSSYWPGFRGDADNMAITDANTPIDNDRVSLKWANRLVNGMWGSISGQIIAEDALFAMSGSSLIKLDLKTGKELARVKMAAGIGFGLSTILYADGKIFCPLSGKIQAFDSKTLAPLWTFTDAIGGQANSPICYSDGRVYTGFWQNEDREANFVCVDANNGNLLWKHTQKGGFYWAGATVVGNAVIVGSDDGIKDINGDSHLFAFNKATGEVISDLVLTGAGDARSSIAFDADSGRVFFVTKNGFLCSAKVDATTGALSDLKSADNHLESTGTPVVYKGQVFYATGSGVGKPDPGYVCVADSKTLKLQYTVTLKSYPQCSLLVSTAYAKKTGKIYLYATYNDRPGGITMIEIDPTKKTADAAKVSEIFTPDPAMQQNCIASIIAGPDGTLYYKNDSGYVMAVGYDDIISTTAKIDAIGEVTLKAEPAIVKARKAYDFLSAKDKAALANKLPILEAAEAKLAELQATSAKPVSDQIAALNPESIKNMDKDYYKVLDAYWNLTPGTQKKVTGADKLVAPANKIIKDLEAKHAALTPLTLKSESDIYALMNAYNDLNPVIARRVPDYFIISAQTMQKFRKLKSNTINDCTNKIDAIGEVTLESEEKILAAREVYDSLLDAFGEEINAEIGNTDKLIAAEAKLSELKVADVTAKIDSIGEVTLESKDQILAVRKAYDALTAEQKAQIKNVGILTAAEEELAKLQKDAADTAAADAVIKMIDEIGKYSPEKADAIKAARKAYDALSAEAKAKVLNYKVLTDAEAMMAEDNKDNSDHNDDNNDNDDNDTSTTPQTGDNFNFVVPVICMAISAIALVAILQIKKKKANKSL